MTEGGVREVRWAPNCRKTLRGFPQEVRWSFGRALHQAQKGIWPRTATPMRGRMRGVIELSENDPAGTYRVYFTEKCPDVIYVLYCHMKKSRQGAKISRHEQDLIVQRLKDAVLDRRENEGDLG
ncbi:type II toxin-antitoxin system RelE/ParE family toxin [Gemmatimonadota bacterium]